MLFSDVGFYDRVVIQELLKTVAQSHQLDASTQRDFKGEESLSLPSVFMSSNRSQTIHCRKSDAAFNFNVVNGYMSWISFCI